MCNDHYEEFISSIDNLIAMKQNIQELKTNISTLNSMVQTSGNELVSKTQQLTRMRHVRVNINHTLDTLRQGQYMVGLASKANKQINEQKFFSALKTLDQLQYVHLPRLSAYDVEKRLQISITHMKNRVKNTVKTDFERWAGTVQVKCALVGERMLARVNEEERAKDAAEHERKFLEFLNDTDHARRDRWSSYRLLGAASRRGGGEAKSSLPTSSQQQQQQQQQQSHTQPREKGSGGSPRSRGWEDEGGGGGGGVCDVSEGGNGFEQDGLGMINLTPVYQCQHIFEILRCPDEFQTLYKQKREEEVNTVCKWQQNGRAGGVTDIATFEQQLLEYFSKICGFFVVEESVAKSQQSLLTEAEAKEITELGTPRHRGSVSV
jgi:hypothetical protein